jgi:excisionase family DNA binding protein
MTVETKQLTMTVEELAIYLSMSLPHTYQQLYAGNILAHHLGRKWVISRQQIENWFNNAPAVVVGQRN